MNMVNRIILFLILFLTLPLSGQVPWLDAASKSDHLRITLVTFGPGDDLFNKWGHGGIIVEDTVKNINRMYNFGMRQAHPLSTIKFILGKSTYWITEFPDTAYIQRNKALNRDILYQELNLPDSMALELAVLLANIALPEQQDNSYHIYYDNCSTQIRDILDQIVEGALYAATQEPGRMSLREHTRRYLKGQPVLEMILMFLINDSVDQPISQWDEMFLPAELARQVRNLHYTDQNGRRRKLVSEEYVYYQSDRDPVPQEVPLHWSGALLTGIFLGMIPLIIAFLNQRLKHPVLESVYGWYTIIIGMLIGGMGLLLSFVASFTSHQITYFNENLFLANPFTALFVLTGSGILLRKSGVFESHRLLWMFHIVAMLIAALFKFLPPFDQDNGLIFAFLAPLYALNGMAAWVWKNKAGNSL